MNGKLRCAILGFGGMGHTHATRYAGQKEIELVALCDIDPKQLAKDNIDVNFGNSGTADTKKLAKFTSYARLIKGIELDCIDICLPSDLHAKYAVRAMRDGFHVLSEKPMALNVRDANRMIAVSRETGKKLMIAQCLRFGDRFQLVKEAYDSGRYGKLLRLDMRRNGGFPHGWFRDVKRSGGALMDLHLHDTDFIVHMLGRPESVRTRGVTVESGGIDDSLTEYIYPEGPVVHSEGAWTRNHFGFSVAAVFEKGTIQFGEGTEGVTLYRMDHELERLIKPEDANDYYFEEIAYFAGCVKNNRPIVTASPESTRDSIALIRLEERSALTGRTIKVNLP